MISLRLFLFALAPVLLCLSGPLFGKAEISTAREFRLNCRRWYSTKIVFELNRALAELRLLHGKIHLRGRTASEVINELYKQKYVGSDFHYKYSWDPLLFDGLSFQSSLFSQLKSEPHTYLDKTIPTSLLNSLWLLM